MNSYKIGTVFPFIVQFNMFLFCCFCNQKKKHCTLAQESFRYIFYVDIFTVFQAKSVWCHCPILLIRWLFHFNVRMLHKISSRKIHWWLYPWNLQFFVSYTNEKGHCKLIKLIELCHLMVLGIICMILIAKFGGENCTISRVGIFIRLSSFCKRKKINQHFVSFVPFILYHSSLNFFFPGVGYIC